ncbi:MAG: hypothetical protein IKV88_03165 [Clostridia bacterium]|nr:hypothetical protein [Clostridia bacterium]
MGKKQVRVRDKFWLFASRAHDDDIFLSKCNDKKWLRSRITPAEGCQILGLSNVIMIESDGIPVPFSHDAYGYMESFYRMDKVWWSIKGSAGFRNGNEEEFICHLAENYPNVCGAFFDDFLIEFDKIERFSEEYITEMFQDTRKRLDKACRPIELWATCYIDDVNKFSPKMYEPLDGITIWNLDTDSIIDMEEEFELYEELLPQKKKMLGIYIYDYRQGTPVSEEYMEMQCETGLKWLKEGKIEGMIFLTNCVMGVGLSSEYWLRDWIDRVGDGILS